MSTTSTLIDPDSLLNIAKNLDAKTFENLAASNQHYRWAYEQIKDYAYKHFLKRDFNYKLVNNASDPKSVYVKAWETRPMVTVLFTYQTLPYFISPSEIARGCVFRLSQVSLEWLQEEIFDRLANLDIFWTDETKVKVKCEVFIHNHGEQNYYIDENFSMMTDTLMIKVPKGDATPAFSWKDSDLSSGFFDDMVKLSLGRIERRQSGVYDSDWDNNHSDSDMSVD